MSLTTPAAERIRPLEDWHFWFVGRDQLVVNLLRRFAASGPVVDAGCGTGRFAARLRLGTSGLVLGIDRHLSAPAEGARWARGDLLALPLASNSVKTVLARDVLEHVDDGPALREICRVLAPGGVLVALVPGWPGLWSQRDEAAGHQRRYRRRRFRAALTDAGLEVLEIRGYQFLLLPLAAVSRVLARWRPEQASLREERPAPRLNALLSGLNTWEAGLAKRGWARPPTGTTLVGVARRPMLP